MEKKQTSLLKKGDKVLIRTATYFDAGEVVSVSGGFVKLTKAAWVADTGRFQQAVATGDFSEVEMFAGPVLVSTGAIIDITPLPKLPTAQK